MMNCLSIVLRESNRDVELSECAENEGCRYATFSRKHIEEINSDKEAARKGCQISAETAGARIDGSSRIWKRNSRVLLDCDDNDSIIEWSSDELKERDRSRGLEQNKDSDTF